MADRDYRDYETDDPRYRRGEERDWSDRGRGGGQQQGERFQRDWQEASGGRSHGYDEQRGYGGSQQGGFGERQQSGYGQSPAQQGGYDDWDERGTRALPRGRGREFARGYGGYEDERGIHRGGRTAHAGYGDQGFRPGMYGYSGGYGGRGGSGGERGHGQGDRDFWDRASDEVASWFGDEEAEQRRRMDEHRGRGPKNYTRSDERIKEDVSDRLSDDGSLDASDIEVEVSGSEVTLNGHVSNRWDKRRAEDIAEEVSGVRHVQNNLRVREASDYSSSSSRRGASGSYGSSASSASGSGATGSTGSSGLSGSSTRRTET